MATKVHMEALSPTMEEGQLVRWLKSDGCTVMLGVPSFWRSGKRDASDDPLLHDVLRLADIISPWSVGRYRMLMSGVRCSTASPRPLMSKTSV